MANETRQSFYDRLRAIGANPVIGETRHKGSRSPQNAASGISGGPGPIEGGTSGSNEAKGTGAGSASQGTGAEAPNVPPAQKRRGRPPGSANATKREERLDLKASELADIIKGMHVAAGMGLQAPELMVNDQESLELAKAFLKLQTYYPVTINPKYAALAAFVSTCAGVYGPRLYLIAQRVQANKPKVSGATPASHSNVIHPDFPQAPRPQEASPAGVDIGPVAAAPAPLHHPRGGPLPLGDWQAPLDG